MRPPPADQLVTSHAPREQRPARSGRRVNNNRPRQPSQQQEESIGVHRISDSDCSPERSAAQALNNNFLEIKELVQELEFKIKYCIANDLVMMPQILHVILNLLNTVFTSIMQPPQNFQPSYYNPHGRPY